MSADQVEQARHKFLITESGTVKGGLPVGGALKVKRDNHFNLSRMRFDDFIKERDEIIRWTKALYCKDGRLVKLEEEENLE